jgi:hypothetical protein
VRLVLGQIYLKRSIAPNPPSIFNKSNRPSVSMPPFTKYTIVGSKFGNLQYGKITYPQFRMTEINDLMAMLRRFEFNLSYMASS